MYIMSYTMLVQRFEPQGWRFTNFRYYHNDTSTLMYVPYRVHLHILFVLMLLYAVCRSVSVRSCVDVIQSFTYGLRLFLFWTSLKDVVWERERKREAIPTASSRYHHKRNEIKETICLWLVCCCLLPTCYFHRSFTSTWGYQRESGWFPPRSSVKVRARIVKLFIFWYFMSKVAPFHSHVCVCVCVGGGGGGVGVGCCVLGSISCNNDTSMTTAVIVGYWY